MNDQGDARVTAPDDPAAAGTGAARPSEPPATEDPATEEPTTEEPTTEEIETAVVTMVFDAADPDALLATLSRYVVLARGLAECRNIDLCSSYTTPTRFVVIEKWTSTEAARTHFDSDLMVEMATACRGILSDPPRIDLLEGLSAHDLR